MEAIVTPELFKIKDIVIGNLLDQYFKEECVKFDSVTIVEDIFKCTLGHKGLIGTCCWALVEKVINHQNKIVVDDWKKFAFVDLQSFVREHQTLLLLNPFWNFYNHN